LTAIDFQNKLINLQEGLMRLAYSLTSDTEDAKDLVQETFLKALRYRDKFATDTNFRAWTFTIMKNTYINSYHRSVRHNIYSDQAIEHPYLNFIHASGSDNPDSLYISKEIEGIIEDLDDDFKLPFKMHHQGFKYKEIAEALGLNIGTLKSRIFITRQKLIKKLNA
jgi:RNA polymerase sigma-70 factor, ECF subfamily